MRVNKKKFEVTILMLQHMLQITVSYKIKKAHCPLKMTMKYEKLSQFKAAITLRCLANDEEQ